MTEFAFSGVGINPHHGTPANPATRAGPKPRIPGGSTSGGAVSVATGAAWAALGSDTGGSIRIPAALQGIVGFKSTQARAAAGAVPLSPTLDTVCAITRSVRDAVLVHEVLADRRVGLGERPLAALRFAVPQHADARRPGSDRRARLRARRCPRSRRRRAIERSSCRRWPSWRRSTPPAASLPPRAGPGTAGCSRAARAGYDPRVPTRIRRGAAISAADYIDLLRARRDWIAAMEAALAGFDAVLSPDGADRRAADRAARRRRRGLLRAPTACCCAIRRVVNLLDGCALRLPCHAPASCRSG